MEDEVSPTPTRNNQPAQEGCIGVCRRMEKKMDNTIRVRVLAL